MPRSPQPCGGTLQTTFTANFVYGKTDGDSILTGIAGQQAVAAARL